MQTESGKKKIHSEKESPFPLLMMPGCTNNLTTGDLYIKNKTGKMCLSNVYLDSLLTYSTCCFKLMELYEIHCQYVTFLMC